MSAETEKTAIAKAIREAYPWLDEAHIELYADKAIKNKYGNT